MRCKIVRSTYVAQYHEVNQKSKKLQFYIINIDIDGEIWIKSKKKPIV